MQKNKRGDTIAGVIISVFILSFTLFGIINILNYNKDISYNYNRDIDKYILKSNAENIIKKIDTSSILNDEKFYIYKDEINKEYKILTGSINEKYKYINFLGENVDKDVNIGKNYTREYIKKQDILRNDIQPPEIPNLIFHFDANNVDGSENSTLSEGQSISRWEDSGNNHDAYQNTSSKRPTFREIGINNLPMVEFDGSNDILKIDSATEINNNGNCYADITYNKKSYAIVLKTGTDVNSTQVIYEEGGQATGYSFTIKDGEIWAGIHNKSNSSYACTDFSSTDSNYYFERDIGHQFKSVKLDQAIPESIYYIMIVQDSTNVDSGGQFIDNLNKLQIFLNGKLVMENDHVDPQPEHHYIGLGAVNEYTVYPWNNATENCLECSYFKGGIGEFISWNHALTKNEVRGIQNYFIEKWLGGEENIEYNIINTEIKEYNF